MPRSSLQPLGAAHDILVAAFSITLALALAYGYGPLFTTWQLWAIIIAFTALSACLFPLFSLNRGAWRYASLLDVISIVKAATAITVIFVIGHFLLYRGAWLPRSAMVTTWFVMIVALGGPRLLYRVTKENGLSESRRSGFWPTKHNALLYGFNDNADLFIRDARRNHSGVNILGLIDPRLKNRRRQLHGIRVLGTLEDLPAVLRKSDLKALPIDELIVTSTEITAQELTSVVAHAAPHKLTVRRLHDISQAGLIRDTTQIVPRPLSLEDLVGRQEIQIDVDEVANLLNGRCVAVTGAGGSIGSELVRQIAPFHPRHLLLVDNNEYALYRIHRHMSDKHPQVAVTARVTDVRHGARVADLFEQVKPEVVFHAAALKHVPIVEDNPLEGIETNLLGTRNVADAALHCGALAFVMVSTDKAVNPANVMGATKRAAETYCQALDLSQQGTRFLTVRFGNVMGSTGSVIPLFQEQLERGGPLTVTHPDIYRYFMTIPEASRLILHAAGHGLNDHNAQGQILVLDMGEPIRILELAERLIQLAGLRPYVDIGIDLIGLRKGEKLKEELFGPDEIVEGTGWSGIMIARSRATNLTLLRRNIDAIESAVASGDEPRAIAQLGHLVPGLKDEAAATPAAQKLRLIDTRPKFGDQQSGQGGRAG
ncbi:polysaccharide biosynthesis protein [Consotaella aegiceratis]|uniref:polysaccharide biosynthesis protein n=1 Tax=Consotaella aegiceratis TaxID=3097961 RepID=UPI002F3F254F